MALSLSSCAKAVKPDFSRYIHQLEKFNQIVETWNNSISLGARENESKQEAVEEAGRTGSLSRSSRVILIREENGWNIWDQLEEHAMKEGNGIAVKCQFQKESANIPFSAISDALADLVVHHQLGTVRQILEKELGEDLHQLLNAFPRLGDCLLSSDPLSPQRTRWQNDCGSSEESPCTFRHLQVLIKKTIRTLASQIKPILFVFEDIHLADPASLDLLKILFSDQDSTSVLYIAAFEDEPHLDGANWIDQIKGLHNLLPLAEICVGLMTEVDVNEMVASVLDLRVEDTIDLSRVVFQKTGGMYFLARQFLQFVHELDLLLYSLKTSRFEWDLDRIVAATDISDNMADLVVNRIERLGESRQMYLRIAACLGYQFKPDLVALLIEHEKQNVFQEKSERFFSELIKERPTESTLSSVDTKYNQDLEELMVAGLVEKGLFGDIKFTHKRIQDAAYELNPPGRDRELLHLRLGYLMVRLLGNPRYDEEIVYFSAIDQLNGGKALLTRREDKMFLIKQNMQAASVAKLRSAFKVSANYLSHAVDLLDQPSCWEEEYDLSLELYTSCSECELNSGQNYQKCDSLVSKVLENGKCMQDKIRACKVKVQQLRKEGELKQSVELGVRVLQKCGLKVPIKSSVFKLLLQLIKTKRALRNVSDDDILQAKHVSDEYVNHKVSLFHMVGYHSYLLGDELLMSICIMMQIRLGLKHGTSIYTPSIFAHFALFLALVMGDIPEACRFMELSLKFLDKTTDLHRTTCLVLVHTFVWHWKYPIRESLDKMILANELGMKSGNVEMVPLCPATYCVMYFYCGLSLKHIDNDMRRFVKDIRDYNDVSSDAGFLVPLVPWQCVLNLAGKAKDPFILTGEAMDEQESIKLAKDSGNGNGIRLIYGWKLWLSVILGDYKAALSCMQKMDKQTDTMKNSPLHGRDLFYGALACFSKAQSGKCRRYHLCKARSCHNTLKVWQKLGNPNLHHLLQILEAENISARPGRYDDAIRAYNKGISFSLRLGYIHDAALAHERCASIFQRQNNQFWSSHHLKEAHRLYAQWNAFAKVEIMEEKYPELKNGTRDRYSSNMSSTGIHERPRHDPRISKKQKELELKRSSSPGAVRSSEFSFDSFISN